MHVESKFSVWVFDFDMALVMCLSRQDSEALRFYTSYVVAPFRAGAFTREKVGSWSPPLWQEPSCTSIPQASGR